MQASLQCMSSLRFVTLVPNSFSAISTLPNPPLISKSKKVTAAMRIEVFTRLKITRAIVDSQRGNCKPLYRLKRSKLFQGSYRVLNS